MQKTLRQQKQQVDDIVHFTLSGLLSGDITLALNKTLGTLTHISCSEEGPRLLTEQQFTNAEMSILLPLLESYPYFCPYEVLLASFNNGRVTEEIIEECRQRLQEAQEDGVWDQEMRPVRNVLSRTRIKLHAFNMDIHSLLETGYVLMFKSKKLPRQLEPPVTSAQHR